MIQRGKYDYDRAELLEAEKCAGLNVFRVTVLALHVFKDTLISLFNLHCVHMCRSHCGWYFLYIKTRLEGELLLGVKLDVEGACGNG